jgi:hypothetical protein
MKNYDPRQMELFADGARAVAVAKQAKPPPPIEADLQAKLDSARMRLHEIVILSLETWLRRRRFKGCVMPNSGDGGRSGCTLGC